MYYWIKTQPTKKIGIPDRPQCGFSKAVVDILRFHGASFESHNVLADESIRNGIKEYTDWPTIPQIFFNGII